MVWFLTQANFHLRNIAMCMRVIRSRRIRNFITFPIRVVSNVFGYMLSNRLLLALEVAIEYWLALSFSMEAKNVDRGDMDGSQEAIIHEALRREMEQQKGCVWQFIIDRCASLLCFAHCRGSGHVACAGFPRMLHCDSH